MSVRKQMRGGGNRLVSASMPAFSKFRKTFWEGFLGVPERELGSFPTFFHHLAKAIYKEVEGKTVSSTSSRKLVVQKWKMSFRNLPDKLSILGFFCTLSTGSRNCSRQQLYLKQLYLKQFISTVSAQTYYCSFCIPVLWNVTKLMTQAGNWGNIISRLYRQTVLCVVRNSDSRER